MLFNKFNKNERLASSFRKNRFIIVKQFISDLELRIIQNLWNRHDHAPYLESTREVNGNHVVGSPWSNPFKTREYGVSDFGVSLLLESQKRIESFLNLELVPTYSYERKYYRDSVLYAHRDRPSCEISATIAIDSETDSGKPWPIWVLNDKNYAGFDNSNAFAVSQALSTEERSLKGCKAIFLDPGDALIYQGINVLHWRDPLEGSYAKQVFIHYVNKNGTFYTEFPELKWDGRRSAFHPYEEGYRNREIVREINQQANDLEWTKARACKEISPI